MSDLKKNKRLIYYATQRKTPIIDEYGNYTGEENYTYNRIRSMRIQVLPASVFIQNRAFGQIERCDRILSTTRRNLPFTKETVFWVDTDDATKPHNYELAGISDGLTTVLYALKLVNLS